MASQIDKNGINKGISWCDYTINLWWGCTKVHEGCDHCYAETLSKRWGEDVWGNDKPRRIINSVWNDLSRFQRLAKESGEINRVFVGSMMDIFERPMPLIEKNGDIVPCVGKKQMNTGDLRNILLENITNGWYNNLMFLFLTKRPSNINKYIPESWKVNPPENVMFGTSPVNQATANKLIPQLLRVNGRRFLSVEPQLGEVNLTMIDADKGGDKEWCMINSLIGEQTDMARPCFNVPKIDWVIQGGESGHHRRSFDLDWAYSMKHQCKEAGVPYFFKQIDKVLPIPEDLMVREFPKR